MLLPDEWGAYVILGYVDCVRNVCEADNKTEEKVCPRFNFKGVYFFIFLFPISKLNKILDFS